jgi:hypothetical protein
LCDALQLEFVRSMSSKMLHNAVEFELIA